MNQWLRLESEVSIFVASVDKAGFWGFLSGWAFSMVGFCSRLMGWFELVVVYKFWWLWIAVGGYEVQWLWVSVAIGGCR